MKMAFFDVLNARTNAGPKYMKGSELPLFVPMKIEVVEFAVTNVGPTTKIIAMLGKDHQRVVESNAVENLMALVGAQQHPYCFAMRGATRQAIRFVPFDVEIATQCRNKSKLRVSQLPLSVAEEIDVGGLAAMGVVLEP
ncbi:Mitofusin-2 [Frankliniella fusca]|uniref:Mitofusin-2 n=1 Tax=Frankliniella fusca TaxID=407009 RepID=A0AAE1HEK4_9NEOP|nr:Mitofusin-2 [Frankliniella fusca]